MQNPTGTIHEVPATEAGALAGWSYTCPTCGLVITFSLESMVRIDAYNHSMWHKEAGR